ncbi:A disintegrin and metalloproteinase with thrombospondin motifs adt-1-like isoform X2 [Haliotis rufescens]|uniref:A disintegrin and metalloproteinase with thrombospondin motifs adt-1-like isoform X2 n=1 Tax=Haliotis rufescens TaxID=6454 RepID=UPI00201EDA2A|nr:A disintegrin and metalloproteinase with thrombospondin motifs adt-1-like isoform X2 [Haliotis rufescens]
MCLSRVIFLLAGLLPVTLQAGCKVDQHRSETLDMKSLKSGVLSSVYRCSHMCWYLRECRSVSMDIGSNKCDMKTETGTTAPSNVRPRMKSLRADVESEPCQNTKHACASQPCAPNEICIPVKAATAHICLPAFKVDGGFTNWTVTDEGTCPVECGGGILTVIKNRTCTDPSPYNGGLPCSGPLSTTETYTCNTHRCPVNGGWSPWVVNTIGTCTRSCGGGTRFVTSRRKCNKPKPRFNGTDCSGDVKEVDEEACNPQACTPNTDGGWTDWAVVEEGDCSVTCGGGSQVNKKERYCDSPVPVGTGQSCLQSDGTRSFLEKGQDTLSCNNEACPVDGGWSTWADADIDGCSDTCGGGTKIRTRQRECTNPAPSGGGEFCQGDATLTDELTCNTLDCPVDGGWTNWTVTSVSRCTQSCGGGQRQVVSQRSCTDPEPAFGGEPCEGDQSETVTEACNGHECAADPVAGGWSYWVWRSSTCSKTCGYGTITRTRERTCDNPEPAHGGATCPGSDTSDYTYKCNSFTCPVDGGWSQWYVRWTGRCSTTCGGGVKRQYSYRWCNNPRRSYGGAYCSGSPSKTEEVPCNQQGCPVSGAWTAWLETSYGTCSVSCGGGQREEISERGCKDPAPAYGGSNCVGSTVKYETKTCNTHDCSAPINGGWASWESDSVLTCSVTCGAGTTNRVRSRTCSNPAPANGGSKCPGSDKDTDPENCNEGACPVDGNWGNWGSPSNGDCSVTCGGGKRTSTRTRTCSNPAPSVGGALCGGSPKEVQDLSCNTQTCPVDGNWGTWTTTSTDPCTVSCGGGTKTRRSIRQCNNPSPVGTGATCPGVSYQTEDVACNPDNCPVDGEWSAWTVSNQESCSKSCGSSGVRTTIYKRTCSDPAPAYGGIDCTTILPGTTKFNVSFCNRVACTVRVDGNWSPWVVSATTACTATCGGGVETVTSARTCTDPAPANGGDTCSGDGTSTEDIACNEQVCPVDGGWSNWQVTSRGSCSVTCGDGTQPISKERACNNPLPSNGGAQCAGQETKTTTGNCNDGSCPVDGGWSAWTEDDRQQCTKTCGGGSQTVEYIRACTNPAPQHGGAQCSGGSTREETIDCNTADCPLKCPGGFTKVEEHNMCYKYESKKRNWEDARDHCKGHDADLVIYKTDAMNKFFEGVIRDIIGKKNIDVYLGGRDRNKNSKWFWLDAEPVKGFSKSGNQNCLKFDDWILDDEDCSDKHPSICQTFA